MRLTRQQQREVLAAMIGEARQRTAQGLDVAEVQQHVERVRDDMKSALKQGLTVMIAASQEEPTP